jgi:hypothetical protein
MDYHFNKLNLLIMKTLIAIFLIIFLSSCVPLPAQTSLNVRAGDSKLKGLLGLELQYCNISLSGGWKPTREAPLQERVQCFSVATTYYYEYNRTSPYLSVGMTDKGISEFNLTSQSYDIYPSMFAVIGIRAIPHDVRPRFSKNFYYDIGLGTQVSKMGEQYSVRWAIEIVFNYNILRQSWINWLRF